MGKKFEVGDRVKRSGVEGPVGSVSKVRVETVRTTLKENKEGIEEPGVTVTVLWDNGTTSHFVPEGLEKA
ncbi:MAG: hypothetical protein IT291_02660 [Deltaproteobacteria bacterium]|nr:hypothetical protein [Deltaproteobacteria bacterium]